MQDGVLLLTMPGVGTKIITIDTSNSSAFSNNNLKFTSENNQAYLYPGF